MTSAHFATLFDWDTIQSADSTEWCPLSPYKNIFVCGTYQIQKKEDDCPSNETSPPTTRHGRIYVFEILEMHHLEQHQVLDLPAVLDMKWCQHMFSGKILLGVVTATGELLIFELRDDKKLVQVTGTHVIADNSKEVLALSLDWSCAKSLQGTSEGSIVVSDSQGGVNLFQLSEEIKLVLIKRWQGHTYEAWISAFNYWEPHVLFSGGDDCILNGWDVRLDMDTPMFVNRTHNAGVTSLQSNPKFEHILASGSYDEQLRLWDLRKMKNPMHTIDMPGGVWRVKWDPFSYNSILAACMHGGFSVVSCKKALEASGEPLLFAAYKNHDSIAYGADWSHLDGKTVELLATGSETMTSLNVQNVEDLVLISTCSFYDHKLCVSIFNKSIANLEPPNT